MYSRKGRNGLKPVRIIIDVVNVVLGLAVLGLAAYIFIELDSRIEMFPYIFYMGAAVNLVTGIKHFISQKKGSAIVAWVFAVLLIFVAGWSGTIIKGF